LFNILFSSNQRFTSCARIAKRHSGTGWCSVELAPVVTRLTNFFPERWADAQYLANFRSYTYSGNRIWCTLALKSDIWSLVATILLIFMRIN